MIVTILKKDLRLYFSDKKGVLITFLLPIIMITLFAFAFGGVAKKKSAPKPLGVLVVDKDATTASQELIAKLNSMQTIRLIASEEDNALDLIRKGKNVAALIFEKGFSDAVTADTDLPIELKYDAARDLQMRIVHTVLKEGFKYHLGKVDVINNVKLKTTSLIKESSTKAHPGLVQAVGGTAIMMLLFSIAAIGGGLLDEKDAGTLKRLLIAPVKPLDILLAKMGTAMVVSILQLTTMFVFAWLAFGLPIFMDAISLVVLILCISFAVSSFGVFLVSTVKTRQQLQGMSTIIIILMSAIGGSMIPISMMPEFMQNIAVISVNYWGIEGFFDIFWRQLPFITILPKMGILLAIGLGMTLVSTVLFKKNIIAIE
ncbi:ABC-type multidrug transport system permease subunit [Aquimarina sp. MAR_2010_214]|uniref:ABC transporter permease n=1 Tax=Aquimarina sp. MAR_2010_214 TaxID=1250026 RepID=UPI000C6FF1C1|nr:ABC transporter permease [Aquimarina sp. MAR_2010_214]PKV51381.1 ABC-type multidrug transport system permease subunit [Aquimarina sp. MAR_2010_214]